MAKGRKNKPKKSGKRGGAEISVDIRTRDGSQTVKVRAGTTVGAALKAAKVATGGMNVSISGQVVPLDTALTSSTQVQVTERVVSS